MNLKQLLQTIIDNPNIPDVPVAAYDVNEHGLRAPVLFALAVDSDGEWLDLLQEHIKGLNIPYHPVLD